jgi:Clp amino terminal domain, pathogenicity island component
MTEFPVPLDNLIAYVKTLHPDGGPLENVADAFAVSEQLDEQSDALLGYFVDQARRSGLPWSQIGGAMGVSKQAAQKRFVPSPASQASLPGEAADALRAAGHKPFSRFTDRAVRVLFAADHLAIVQAKGGETADSTGSTEHVPIGAGHLAAAFLSEPEGVAAKAIHQADLSPEQVYAAVGTGPAPQLPNQDRALLPELTFDDSAKGAFKEALRWALRMGHNYIGTEHLLLGVMFTGGPTAEAFTALGLPPQRAEQLIVAELTAYQANLQGQLSSMGRNRPIPEPNEAGELYPSGWIVCTAISRAAERVH